MALSPPPPRRRRRRRPPSPADNAMREIFLRVPADDPGSLVRAAAVCRSWCRILSDAAFAREYRAFRRAPPMLGFLHNERHRGYKQRSYWVSHFVSTATFSPPAFEDLEDYQVLDSRHGLVLLHSPGGSGNFVAWDLVTHEEWSIHADPKCHDIMWWEGDDPEYKSIRCNAAVLCDKDLCDHLDCHGGPFRVALVGSDDADGSMALATVYSSKTREWSDMISVHVHEPDLIYDKAHSAVVGNKVYVPCVESTCVLEYNMGEQELSVINVPYEEQDKSQRYVDLMGVEDGMLLFASVMKPRLYLWSMEAGPNGAVGWARHRFIELEPLLPRYVLDNSTVSAVGFAEGVGVIFVSTQSGFYTIELGSGRGNEVNVEGQDIKKVMPYMSFYIGARGLLD